MRQRWDRRRCFAPVADDSFDYNDDDSRASCHPHLHDHQTPIVPGRMIGLRLRIRRFGVRILSGAAYRGINRPVSGSRLDPPACERICERNAMQWPRW
jgi:hypothetical protein